MPHRFRTLDLCGKEANHRYTACLASHAESVDYYYYMEWGSPEEIARQGKDG